VVEGRGTFYQRLPFFYGWLIFFATLVIYMMAYGLRYSFGVFFTPLMEEFGWNAAATAGALSLHLWTYGLAAPFTGKLTERIGVRRAIALGGFLLGGGAFLVSYTREIWHLYLFWGALAPTGAVILYVVPTIVLTRFFEKKRGKAVGWASIGISLGTGILVPSAGWLLKTYGWRASYQLFGGMTVLTVGLLGYIILREDPESLGLRVDGGRLESSLEPEADTPRLGAVKNSEDWTRAEALRTRSFRFLALSYFFMFGSITSLNIYFVPHIIQLGIEPLQSSQTFGVVGLMSAVGSFIFGFVSDKIGRRPTIVISSAMIAVLALVLTSIPPTIMILYLWAITYGIAYGGIPEQYAAIIVDYFGRRYSTSIFGLLTFFGAMGGGLFPLISGFLRDITGAYYAVILFLSLGSLLMTITILPAIPPSRGQQEKP